MEAASPVSGLQCGSFLDLSVVSLTCKMGTNMLLYACKESTGSTSGVLAHRNAGWTVAVTADQKKDFLMLTLAFI